MNAAFHKISIDFEYLNEIYTINSDPYKTLSELKDIVLKKIFPCPRDVHCFYKNVDLFDKEEEEIIKMFPHNSKVKIKLKKPSKEVRHTRRSIIARNNRPHLVTLVTGPTQNYPKIEAIVSPEKKSKTIRKRKIERLMSLPSTNSKTSMNFDHEIKEETLNDNIKNDDLFYLLHKNEIDKYKTSKKVVNDGDDKEMKMILNKYKRSKNENFLTAKKEVKDVNFLLSSLKGKNFNKLKLPNNVSWNLDGNKNSNNKIPNTVKKGTCKIRLKRINSSDEEKESEKEDSNTNLDNNETNKTNKDSIDENYICSSCKEEIISEYCLNCNEFKCNSCIELCKADQHEYLKIELDDECIKNIMTYGELVTSNIDKNLEEVMEYNKEIQIYDIKSFRDNLITFINEIFNLYNEITSILENVYKEKGITKEMNKFESESNKIKTEVNEILHKANSYLKSDVNISKPKYKIMNMQYFFNLINEKGKEYNSINNNMKKYSLNLTINSNIEKCFKDIENRMKSITDKENPFSLKEDLKNEYKKLIQNNKNSKKDRKKMYLKRKTLSLKPPHYHPFHSLGSNKDVLADLNNSDILDE